jgi:hypothetical protein
MAQRAHTERHATEAQRKREADVLKTVEDY